MEIRSCWVDIEDAAGARLGRGPLRLLSGEVSSPLSASGEFRFDLPAADPNLSALSEKRVAICRYVDRDGAVQTFGGGVIDKIEFAAGQDGTMTVQISGNDLTRELTYRSVGALSLAGVDAAGVTDGPEQIMALAPAGWTIEDGETLTALYVGYDGESVLNALSSAGKKIGEHWRLDAGRVIQWLGASSTFVSCGVRAVQQINDVVTAEIVDDIAVISKLEEVRDAADLLTRVIPRGSGNGSAIVTLELATDTPPAGYTLSTSGNYVKRDASETAYGRIERILDFKEIGPLSNTTADIQAAANMLLVASVEHLARYGAPQKFYQLELAGLRQLLQPGTTIRVVYRKLVDNIAVYDLDGTFSILDVRNRIDAGGLHTASFLISTIDRLPASDASLLASQVQEARVLATHQQLGPSADTLTWREEMDNVKSITLRFWLGDEYTSIQRARLRFQIKPLRSTVKSVTGASGGGSTVSSASGGGSVQTSSTVGSIAYNTGDNSQAGDPHHHLFWLIDHSHTVSIPAHTHDVTLPNHSHTTTMEYGIFEETSGNTLALSNLVIKLNGGSDLRSLVTDIGNGWYELDITDDLVDAARRPSQENNAIEISTATAKTARIEAQLTILSVVQAVLYE